MIFRNICVPGHLMNSLGKFRPKLDKFTIVQFVPSLPLSLAYALALLILTFWLHGGKKTQNWKSRNLASSSDSSDSTFYLLFALSLHQNFPNQLLQNGMAPPKFYVSGPRNMEEYKGSKRKRSTTLVVIWNTEQKRSTFKCEKWSLIVHIPALRSLSLLPTPKFTENMSI